MQTNDIGPDANGNPRGWLRSDAAASIARVDADLGRPLDVNSGGRTEAEQQHALDTLGPGIAAAIEDSWHVKGIAVDSDDARDDTILSLLYQHGWLIETWEWWHLQYHPELDQHRNTTNPAIPTQEDPMALRIISSPFYRAAGFQVLHNGIIARSIPAVVALSLRQASIFAHDYDDEGAFNTELREVWENCKVMNASAAEVMGDEFAKQLAK